MVKKVFSFALLVFFCFIFSFGWYIPDANAFTEEQKLLLQSWRIVNQSYLDETFNHQNWWKLREKYVKKSLRDREETYTAIEEMLASLDDPFTRLLRPEQYRSLQVNTSGQLSGVGLQININPTTKLIEVIAPLAGSPAESAGIEPKDSILEIDGVDTKTITLDEAAARMRGKIGTKVSLRIQSGRDKAAKPRTLNIVRDRISLNPVYTALDTSTNQKVGYVRLNQFSANAAQEIAHGVSDLESQGASAYILDLRNNPGGLLQAGVEIARMWLEDGTIVYTVNRQGALGSFDSTSEILTSDPLVVLVNQGTASASEILAGALQDNERALLVGEKTFGKGLIQSLFELPDGAGLAVTVAKYETPNHTDINKLGIMPDDVVSQQPITYAQIATDVDLQYQEALKLVTSKNNMLAEAG
ncbi:PDZ domain-containing protein [Waterburya agarophytonicola K14]|uniref:Carboxyl-terminal-processing protease n=1 Tax=Waterburya agarophytonicola KI4 TaxID=2874699 RepID=A0A964BVC5_9CYAN|nr:carboxyl-terminal processing protease CtpA [Waterburya agarophytonicola]MCC0179406.1 PDZ domain-containing protein [Waterburya agarophytonicola KI4]